MTKEEVANIKRIDTSLNVFRKKIKALEAKKLKVIEPLDTEISELNSEIDFWQYPVLKRYGKTTEELLSEAGEQTSEDISSEEEKEVISEEKVNLDSESEMTAEAPSTPEEQFNPEEKEPETTEDFPDAEWPEEWN